MIEIIRTRRPSAPPCKNEPLTGRERRALRRLAGDFERAAEYYRLRNSAGRYIWLGLINGMARGVGFAIGVTVLTLLLIHILRALQLLELPLIGDFLAELMEYVEDARAVGVHRF